MKRFLLALFVLSLSARAQPPARSVLVKAGRLLDVRAGRLIERQGLLIVGDRIKEVGALKDVEAKAPKDATVVDLNDRTVLPGLIDCHAHLLDAMTFRLRTTENLAVTVAQMGLAQRALLGAANAKETLEAGFTTVRNVGHSGRNGDVALRDAIEEGWVPGPRVLASTRKITPPGGQGMALQSAVADAVIAEEYRTVTGVDDARRAVREALALTADVVKIVLNDDPPRLSVEEVRAIVDEAHRGNIKVAAHAFTTPAVQIAVDGGVDSVEHGDEATDAQLTAMRDKGIFLVATDWPAEARRDAILKERNPTPAQRAMLAEIFAKMEADGASRLARAKRLGVKIAGGSDMWFRYPGKNHGEATLWMLKGLKRGGLANADVLRAVTVSAAELLGWQERVGELAAGRLADLIAVDGDPLADLDTLDHVVFVMKGGEVVKRR